MNNPYYNPTEMGLKIVHELDDSSLCYEFDQLVLWEETSSGKLYWASDSGCSCPVPFENLGCVGDMTPVLSETLHVLELAVKNFPCESSDKQALLRKAKRRLRST